jgi:tRNA pseudouridine synthase 10
MIHRLRATFINEHYMHICLLASAGTYIKEFVHGDLGRTVPSLGSLLVSEADILQLDVTNVYDSLASVSSMSLD